MEIKIPECCLVALVGATGSGKSSFARKHFDASEVVSSDACRAWVSGDETRQDVSDDAFDLLYFMVRKRLKNGLLTVIDATNVHPDDRKKIIDLAREYHVFAAAIVLNEDPDVCIARNAARPERRHVGKHVVINHTRQLRRSIGKLKEEGFRYMEVLRGTAEIESATITRTRLFNNLKHETGPFDMIGDVHGCAEELRELLLELGYTLTPAPDAGTWGVSHPDNRRVIFLGDLVDRGPDSPAVLRLVMKMAQDGMALCVPGNHDIKLVKYLDGKNVKLRHGLEHTAEQLAGETPEFREQIRKFLDSLISHYVLDGGKLVVAHAGLKEAFQGRTSGAVREFCLFGETTGETDEFGLPVRYNWAADYRGKATVVYGHTPVPDAQWFNNTICLDTGCVFGGKLTALRYPERHLLSVPAKAEYYPPARPLNERALAMSLQLQYDDMLDMEDVRGKMIIETRFGRAVHVRPEQSAAAFEVMSRFAINPKWLIYLPPTMSPCETSPLPDYLEHPAEAFNYYRERGLERVICEEKHMGSRAIVVVCRNVSVAAQRFGVQNEGIGACYTRTGRNFFNDPALEKAFLEAVNKALTDSGFWEKFDTGWACLDCELMPWSAKAQGLLQEQYAAVGAAASKGLGAAVEALRQTAQRLPDAAAHLLARYETRAPLAERFVQAYRQYCWPVTVLSDYKLAPFHLLATEGKTYFDKDHLWHLEQIQTICVANPELLLATRSQVVDLEDPLSEITATQWWETMTAAGGEGMVVKPLQFISRDEHEIFQPAVKCRGREYLRIIYGPEYSLPEHLERLKKRGLSSKRLLAMREFMLGMEALERFVAYEPLRRTHACVFGVLALESEPLDPRL